MENQVLMVFKAPSGTQMHISEESMQIEKRYKIQMQSQNGPIGVWVINDSVPEPPLLPPPPVLPDTTTEVPLTSGAPSDLFLDDTSLFLNEDFPGLCEYYVDDLFGDSVLPME